jgi:hypothetical protein
MEHLRSHGYPVPGVEELSDNGEAMVIEHIDGDDMVAAMTSRPWTIAVKVGYSPTSIDGYLN